MFEHIKDFIIFCFRAGSRMQDKSDEFSRKRKKRMQDFRAEQERNAQKYTVDKPHLNAPKNQHPKEEKSEDLLQGSYFATSEDVDALKQVINELENKVESLRKKQKSQSEQE